MLNRDPQPEIVRDTLVCAQVLRRHRDEVVQRLLAGDGQPRENRFNEVPELFGQRVADGLDLLTGHLEGRPDFGALYAGQRNFELTRIEQSAEVNLEGSRKAVAADRAVLRSFLQTRLEAADLESFDHAYDTLTLGLVSKASRHVRTLFVGDCFLGEIVSFLVGPLLNADLSIEPFPVNARDASQLKQVLDALSTKTFDVVFFSPFSHARTAELEAITNPAHGLTPANKLDAMIDSVLDQTRVLLDVLTQRFECPIYVHNAGLIPRATSSAKSAVKLIATRRARQRAGARINRWLSDYVAMRNGSTFQHLFIVDEIEMVKKHGRLALSRYLNASAFQHATVLSRCIAAEYLDRIMTIGKLAGRKLIICDLDNTLWNGVIGEGAVTHFADRQTSLKRLKDHAGVVLSIASKNEPANVRFDGGVLALDDFVAPQISWNLKSAAVTQIRKTLNLQTRHMVFIDDRADERALVQEAHPDILTLDACDPKTWELLDLWCATAFGSSDVDRTRMYQEQALRDTETGSADADASGPVDVESLKKIELVITVSEAKRGDLKRVSELINRTNQWNLCGSRTTFEQVRSWADSKRSRVLIAGAADRFGDMGTVCVAIVTDTGAQVEIPVFVLSCRVFGYGVESAMLAEISRLFGIAADKPLIGRFLSTTQNHPCRNMYTDHGFHQGESGGYRWDGATALPDVPWARIEGIR